MRILPRHENTPDEDFMVRAITVLTRPGKLARTFGVVANGLFYLTMTAFLGSWPPRSGTGRNRP